MAKTATQSPSPRPVRSVQPKCARMVEGKRCNHAQSFHPNKQRCRALGCHCGSWQD